MKSASAQLIALLNSNTEFYYADLLTITLTTGTVLRYTSWQTDLVVGGHTFSSDDTGFVRRGIKSVVGLTVDALEFTLWAPMTTLLGGVPLAQAIGSGAFDGATVLLERVFMPSPGDVSPGTLYQFDGYVSNVKCSRNSAVITVSSPLQLLDTMMPRNLYQPGCWNTLYDTGCGVVRATFLVSGTVSSGSTKFSLHTSLTQSDHYFELGTITFTSGQNTGAYRTVKTYLNASGEVDFALPLPYAPTTGDAFTIVPGCDKTLGSQGCAKFSNTARFRGTRFVPTPEAVR